MEHDTATCTRTSALPQHVDAKVRECRVIRHDRCPEGERLRANQSIERIAMRAGELSRADRRDRVNVKQSKTIGLHHVREIMEHRRRDGELAEPHFCSDLEGAGGADVHDTLWCLQHFRPGQRREPRTVRVPENEGDRVEKQWPIERCHTPHMSASASTSGANASSVK